MSTAQGQFAGDSGWQLGQLIYELTRKPHRLGSDSRLSVLIIINNDTDETLRRSRSNFSYGKWHDGSKYAVSGPPEVIGPRSTATCLAQQKEEGVKHGITGNLDYMITRGGSTQVIGISFDNPNYSTENIYSASTNAEDLTVSHNSPQGEDVNYEVSITMKAEDPVKVEGAYLSGTPSAVAHDDGKLYCFYRGQNDNDYLWYTVYEQIDGVWKWRKDARCDKARLCHSPSALSFNGKIYVFYQGTQRLGHLFYNVLLADGTWSDYKRIESSGMSYFPSACVYRNKIQVFYQGLGENGMICHNASSDGQNWEGERKVENNVISEAPSVVVDNDRLICFYQGANHCGQLWSCTFNGSTWENHARIDNMLLSASPSVVFDKDKVKHYVFHQASDQVHKLWCNSYDGMAGRWSGDRQYFNLWMSTGPGAVVFQGKIYVFHEGWAQALWYKVISL